MADKLKKKKIKKLAKLGRDSYGVVVPVTVANDPKWKEKRKIPVKHKTAKSVSSDWRNRPMDNRQVTHNLRRRMGR
jgi:hypothetical protein